MLKPNQTSENASWCGDPKRGAAHGRSGSNEKPESLKFSLQRVRLDLGGYDSFGAYWGHGSPLYWYCSDCGKAEGYIRYEHETLPRNDESLLLWYGNGPATGLGAIHGNKEKLTRLEKEFPDYLALYRAGTESDKLRAVVKLQIRAMFPGAKFHR